MTDVIRKTRPVAGYPELERRLSVAYGKVRPSGGDAAAYSFALLAVAEFIRANGPNEIIACWLLGLGSKLTDSNAGKEFSSAVWRQYALVAIGMRALMLGKVARQGAARRARRAVKAIRSDSDATILSRYDSFRSGRIGNKEGMRIFGTNCSKLEKGLPPILTREPKAFERLAQGYFDLANLCTQVAPQI
jgi:hypothetical protein